jgi:hypothetical protein
LIVGNIFRDGSAVGSEVLQSGVAVWGDGVGIDAVRGAEGDMNGSSGWSEKGQGGEYEGGIAHGECISIAQ